MSAIKIKAKLTNLIEELSANPGSFLRNPTKDFTRKRKIDFSDTLSLLLAMEGKSTTNELLRYYRCSKDTPTASALRQQRDKIKPEAFECLFRKFSAACTGEGPLYNGYRLLAVDGSDLLFIADPSDPDSYYSGENGQKPYSILHLNALFDLRQKVYVDAIVQKSRLANEHRALCDMVDRSSIDKAILLADRNYESYNDLAHLQEKGWKFLIRVKDGNSGIVSALPLPKTEAFDCAFQLSLTRSRTNELKKRMKEDPSLKYIASSSPFDFLPSHAQKNEPCVIYNNLSFRVVRFHLTDSSFETVLTNLDASEYSPSMLKQLYAMRWGIETSFRDLKYTVGLASFHSKKVDHVLQEVFARLTMYNFSELITACAVIRSVPGKLACQANFSAAVHICREFFRGIVHPPDVEALIARFLSPVRPDRKRNRNLSSKGVISFLYRIA